MKLSKMKFLSSPPGLYASYTVYKNDSQRSYRLLVLGGGNLV